jgi:hypothetical protein
MAGSPSLSREEMERILRTLEEDREFRYALMGLLGFRELLERFARLEERQQALEERQQRLEEKFAELEERFLKLEERQQRLEERFAELEERFAELEERVARLEERFASLEERVTRLEERFAELEERFLKLEERVARLEERVTRLEERFADLEERFLKLEERVARLEERVARVEEELRDTRRVLVALAHRFGVISEAGFREAMRYVVEEALGAGRVERRVMRDEEGIVYGHPAQVEIDVLVRDREHVIVEVKSRVSRGDVAEAYRIGLLYERVHRVRPRIVVVGGLVDPEAYETAARLGVEVRPATRD